MALTPGTRLGVYEVISPLGVLVYEMATGRKAFDGKSQAGLIAAILDRQPRGRAAAARAAEVRA